jgi:hypothetical protein
MEIVDLIPNRYDENWVVTPNYLMYKKLELHHIAYIEEGIVYLLLDFKITNQLIKLIKYLTEKEYEFYFKSFLFNDDAESTIHAYLYFYLEKKFNAELKKIDFDFILNMVKWAHKFKCDDKIRPVYKDFHRKVNNYYYDFFSGKSKYSYDMNLIHEYNSLSREIQLDRLMFS